MEGLDKIERKRGSLVDQVEDRLMIYFKDKGLKPGDGIPNETELAAEFGVARSVVREALCRFKMMGMIESRTKRGMVITPINLFGNVRTELLPELIGEDTLFELLEFRVALEIGISGIVFRNMNPDYLRQLREIVRLGGAEKDSRYSTESEVAFHTKMYEITGNRSVMQFTKIICPVLEFAREKYGECFAPIQEKLDARGLHVNHLDLVDTLESGSEIAYKKAVENHFKAYTIYIENRKKLKHDE
jgi:GntR family transcriptional repressor for pyruvate dehydrogenase complex